MYSTCLAFSMVRKTDDHFISSVATEYVKILWFSSLQIVNVIIIKCRTLLKSRRSRAFDYEILVLWSVLALPIRWYSYLSVAPLNVTDIKSFTATRFTCSLKHNFYNRINGVEKKNCKIIHSCTYHILSLFFLSAHISKFITFLINTDL